MRNRFTKREIRDVRKYAHELIKDGLVTGVNIIRSNEKLPETSISVHFLHNSPTHINHIITSAKIPNYKILPRETVYFFDPSYLSKIETEYQNAEFIDKTGNIASREKIKEQKELFLVSVNELELLVPLNSNNLESIITNIKHQNQSGPSPWIDPVIIAKTKKDASEIPGFFPAKYVCVEKKYEEAYTVVENEKCDAIHSRVRESCIDDFGKSRNNTIIIHPAQINEEFLRFIRKYSS